MNTARHRPNTYASNTASTATGNLLSGGGRTLTWDSENRVSSVTATGVTESSTYDADGERVTKTSGALTTVYLEGVWEEVVGGAVQLHYAVGGMLAAVRDSGSGAVTYLHSDHLGSVSLATTNSGSGPVVASEQLFTPWGAVRTGGIGQTTTNYTGQRLDSSGLLYYHARYYDPALARFVSADSVVPGSASGSMDGVALKPLTVDFHEPGFATTLAGENAQPFRFQMNGEQRQQAGYAGGPLNPQALNRYSYVLNNPVNATDPTGHHYKVEPGGGGKGPGGGSGGRGGGRGTSVPAVASPPLRGGPKPGTYYDGGRYVPSTGQAAGDAATIAAGAALIAAGVQQAQDNAADVGAEPVILESRNRYAGDKRTARRIINDDKQGRINNKFPKEWMDKTPDEIYEAAQEGTGKSRTAKKLLDGKEYDKDVKR